MKKTPKDIIQDLQPLIKSNISSNLINRLLYATDASIFKIIPAATVELNNLEDLKTIINYAKTYNIPIAPRGGGTGLAGESLTNGIVIDFTVHMNKVLEISSNQNYVKVQPGIIHGYLNQELLKYNKIFGPDPATSNRCTIGGMIANNSTGAHSLKYKMTRDWIKSIKVMLDDGSIGEFKKEKIGSPDFQKIINENTRRGEIYRSILPLLDKNEDLIVAKWPICPRNRHGYLLKDILSEDSIDLSKLFAASEGTLGILVEATLGISNLPKYSQLIYLSFKDRIQAARATAPLLKYKPSAIEIIDNVCLDMARTNPIYANTFGPNIGSLLLVELDGDNLSVINQTINKIHQDLIVKEKLAIALEACKSEEQTNTIWNMRKLISGMINRFPDRHQPIPVIEDVCVAPEKLPQYIEGVDEILTNRNLKYLCFGHAGDGIIHIRPFLDIKCNKTYDWLPDLCNEIYDLSLKLNGSISGEHGDGLLRAPFIYKQYGELYETFKAIKNIFDPTNIFNPNKKTGCPDFSHWQKNLRYDNNYQFNQIDTQLIWPDGKLQEIIEACNGCGACRSKLLDTDMCPMFRLFGTEIASPRAKANIMRSFMTGEVSHLPMNVLLEVANYCINCKMCSIDCPSNVKASDLMLEIKAQAAGKLGQTMDTKFLSRLEDLLSLASFFPKITNFFTSRKSVKYFMEVLMKVSTKREIPKLTTIPFYISHKSSHKNNSKNLKVIYFIDMYANLINCNIATQLVNVLKYNDIEVIIPNQKSCGIIELNYGNIRAAKKRARYNIKQLYPYVKNGHKIICTEPTAALMLRHEYLMLEQDEKCYMVSQAVVDIMSFLDQLLIQDKLKTDFASIPYTFGYHTPCHLKALGITSLTPKILKLIPSLEIESIEQGCCGIAGTYGMRKKGFENSLKIGSKLFAQLSDPKIHYGLTECSTCKMQMEQGVPNKKTFHPIEIISASYGLSNIR